MNTFWKIWGCIGGGVSVGDLLSALLDRVHVRFFRLKVSWSSDSEHDQYSPIIFLI